jgi:hypothetical protein
MEDWLIVDKTAVDLTGRTCDKVGVSYSAFRLQNRACSQPMGRCVLMKTVLHARVDVLDNGRIAQLLGSFCPLLVLNEWLFVPHSNRSCLREQPFDLWKRDNVSEE